MGAKTIDRLRPLMDYFVDPPKDPLGKATSYTFRQGRALQKYFEVGAYEIDTHLVEKTIRPTCMGKKNWLVTLGCIPPIGRR